jgi:Core-2/I-Branching enzyme
MARITFVILAHENADQVADLADMLTKWDADARAVIHYDKNSSQAQFARLTERVGSLDRVYLVPDRVKCGWGDFSLVDAVVRALRVIRKEKIACDRVMLVSGACVPIRPLKEFSQFLDENAELEFIEAFDSDWMVGGLRKERYQYWHFFNHSTQHAFFNAHYQIQRRIWPKRRFPRGLEPRFGSQWWCLSWKVCEKILNYIQKHPLTYFFFSTVWIPDEMFFQTMVFHFTPVTNIARRTLTFFHFNDWGKPIVFVEGHEALLSEQPFFFARKVSARATGLRAHFAEVALGPVPEQRLKIDFSKRYQMPFKAMIAALPKAYPMAPQLFQHRRLQSWSDILDNCSKSFVILYGPPALTRRAARTLSKHDGMTVLGRVLARNMVDFGEGKDVFHGLHRDDHLIRDIDKPVYFGRILTRCESLPVIELCPGDDPGAEAALLSSPNAIVLPIVSNSADELSNELHWMLCAGPDALAQDVVALNGHEPAITAFRKMRALVDGKLPKEHRTNILKALEPLLSTQSTGSQWKAAIEFQHGTAALPLIKCVAAVEQVVESADVDDVVEGFPDAWKEPVAKLAAYGAGWKLLKPIGPVSLYGKGN